MEKFEVRLLLPYYRKQNFKVTEATRKICEMKGEKADSVRVAQYWF